MTRASRAAAAALCAVLVVVSFGPTLRAQRRGGRSGRGETADGAEFYPPTRLQILETAFGLKKEQKKAVKSILDDAHKRAAPIREGLISARAAIAAAVEAGKSQSDVDAAVSGYASQAAAMAALEMKALADVIQVLEPAQRANQTGIRSAFFLMRGMFLDNKRWDDVPDNRGY